MLRDHTGKFVKGSPGFWNGKKRPNISGKKNKRWNGGLFKKICLGCNKNYYVQKNRLSKSKFCSHSCRARWNFMGILNPQWKGGKPREKRTELPEYNEWRKAVYKRDGWICKICKYRGGRKLVAHHIRTYEAFPKLRFELDNGITLCRSCHCKLHAIHRDVTDFRGILRDYTLGSVKTEMI